MRKLLSVFLSFALMFSMVLPVVADQVWGDAVNTAVLSKDNSTSITAKSDGSWSVNIGVFIVDQIGKGQQSDIASNGRVDGTISASAGVTLSKTTWSLNSYAIEDIVSASGVALVTSDYTVTFNANSDESGISKASDIVTIHVIVPTPTDTTKPVITVPDDITVEATSANGAEVTFEVIATDDVDGTVAVICDHESGSIFPLGTTLVTCKATDAAGNKVEKTFNIIVKDTKVDNLTAPADVIDFEATAIKTPVVLGEAVAEDIFGIKALTNNAPTDGFGLGLTEVTWTALDNNNNEKTATQKVTIVDTTKPVFTNEPINKSFEATAVNTPIADIDFGTIIATDIFGVTITNNAPATFPLGDTTVTWTATDGNGLTSTANQIITIVDTTKPEFTFVPATLQIKATGENTPVSAADLGTAIATDIFGVTVTNNAPSTFPIGKTTITWTATDGNGLISTANQDVIVTYNVTGFFQPIDMGSNVVNTVKAGSAIPVKFSLNGNMGLNVFAEGYPKVGSIVAATNSGLTYDSLTKTYTYVWKTDKSWAGAGKQLVVKLKDGTIVTANFLFK